MASRAAEHGAWAVQGDRTHLPGARLRRLEHHVYRRRQRADRDRSADLQGDGSRRARSVFCASPEADAVAVREILLEGDVALFRALLETLDQFDGDFNVVEP
ncbi:alkyl sulfatase C-terminal domain-containing protein [Paraburkholderia caribensis]|uniref:alkyl sulfatase C-terminal domain-containing protein n=1 Tax=Paraburkholderia caribensis TaxID=75105 RepID=UPI003AAA5BAA